MGSGSSCHKEKIPFMRFDEIEILHSTWMSIVTDTTPTFTNTDTNSYKSRQKHFYTVLLSKIRVLYPEKVMALDQSGPLLVKVIRMSTDSMYNISSKTSTRLNTNPKTVRYDCLDIEDTVIASLVEVCGDSLECSSKAAWRRFCQVTLCDTIIRLVEYSCSIANSTCLKNSPNDDSLRNNTVNHVELDP